MGVPVGDQTHRDGRGNPEKCPRPSSTLDADVAHHWLRTGRRSREPEVQGSDLASSMRMCLNTFQIACTSDLIPSAPSSGSPIAFS